MRRCLGAVGVVVAVLVGALSAPSTSSAAPTFAFEFGGAATGPPGALAQAADGAAVDRDGNVWIVDRFTDRVVKYDYNGGFIAAFGGPTGGGGTFDGLSGIAADRTGNVHVVDNSRVVVMTVSGRFVRAIGQAGDLDTRLNNPIGVAVDDRGWVYVADSGRSRILVYNANGAHQRSIATVPNALHLTIGARRQIYATQGSDVLRLSNTGTVLASANASSGTAAGVAWNPFDKRVYVGDFGGGVLKSFSSDLTNVNTLNAMGAGVGQSNGPSGVAADCRGSVYMVDGAVPAAGGFPGASKVLKFAEPLAKPPPCAPAAPPPDGLDTQLNDIEVTQGVHALRPYTATDAGSGPRTRAFGDAFGDIALRLGGKTVVRVYV